MMTKYAEILPGIGLAGIKLGQSLKEIDLDRRFVKLVNGQKLAFALDGAVCVFFDDQNNVSQINALDGYTGRLCGEYYISQPVSEIINDGWLFSDQLDGFTKTDIRGVIIYSDLEEACDEEIAAQLSSLKIKEIGVAFEIR